MAYTITIHNPDHSLEADVVPCHGGMVSQIRLQGKALLHLDQGALEAAPMSAGGMPLLFPFPSRTREDRYSLEGTVYHMPMHGLVKNAPFALRDQRPNGATLWMESSPAWMAQCYPFPFHLEADYQIRELSLLTRLAVSNPSDRPMPHYLGWHPFFRAEDKSAMALRQEMTVHYDYQNRADLPMPPSLPLGSRLDDVFHSPRSPGFTLTAPAEGYEVRCVPDDSFQALVVCSWVEGSMCVEPWCGLPDSINSRRFVSWIGPGTTETYTVEWHFRPL